MLFYYHYNLIHFYSLKKALPRHGNIPANQRLPTAADYRTECLRLFPR